MRATPSAFFAFGVAVLAETVTGVWTRWPWAAHALMANVAYVLGVLVMPVGLGVIVGLGSRGSKRSGKPKP